MAPRPKGPGPSAMQDRPLRSRAQVATALSAVQGTAEQLTRLAAVRAKDAAVAQLAGAHLSDIMRAREELVRTCSPVRAESAFYERVKLLGQEWLESLRVSAEDDFDPHYLSALDALYAELLDMLDASVAPQPRTPELREMEHLQSLMLRQKQGADALLLKLSRGRAQ